MADQTNSGDQELDATEPVAGTSPPHEGQQDDPQADAPPPEANSDQPDVPNAADDATADEAPVPQSSDAAPQSDAVAPDAPDAADQPNLPAAAARPDTADLEAAGDTDTIVESPEDLELREATTVEPNWQLETSAHRIAIELKRVESEVRKILDVQDSRRKRKLMGTRRWRELEEDMIRWHYNPRMDQAALKRLSELLPQRNLLFQRLHFLAGTRVGWNT